MTEQPLPTTLSIIIPIYNEAATLPACVAAVLELASDDLHLDVHLIDDGSTDESPQIGDRLAQQHACVRMTSLEINQGKGAAVRSGFELASGDFIAIQDADLEYTPSDLLRLLEPLRAGEADVVFGSRFQGRSLRSMPWRQAVHCQGNRALTWLSNRVTGLSLTDMETCYKVFRRDIVARMQLDENRFAIEPQITAQVAKLGVRVIELPISYAGRGYGEGKKIGIRDAFRAAYCILFRCR